MAINVTTFLIDLGVTQQFEIVSESKRSGLNVSKSNISVFKGSSAHLNADHKENLSAIAGIIIIDLFEIF